MFLSKISIHSCMSTHYIMQENIFVVIVYNWHVILKAVLKLMVKEELSCPKKGEYRDDLRWLKNIMKILRTLLNVCSVIKTMLMLVLK